MRRMLRGPRDAQPGGESAHQAKHHRRAGDDRAYIGEPAHEEREQLAEGGSGEEHRSAVLVESPGQGSEDESHGHEGEGGPGEDEDTRATGREGGDGGRDEEDPHPHDAVDTQGEEGDGPDRASHRPDRIALTVIHPAWRSPRAERSGQPLAETRPAGPTRTSMVRSGSSGPGRSIAGV